MKGEWIKFQASGEEQVREGVVRREIHGFYIVDTDEGPKRVWPGQVL